MNFKQINTPQKLMEYLDSNFCYGVLDKNGNICSDSTTDEFQNICNTWWRLRPVEKMLKDSVGHCFDQVEIEREWFVQHGFKTKTFWICTYLPNIENSGLCHSYLLYKDNTV